MKKLSKDEIKDYWKKFIELMHEETDIVALCEKVSCAFQEKFQKVKVKDLYHRTFLIDDFKKYAFFNFRIIDMKKLQEPNNENKIGKLRFEVQFRFHVGDLDTSQTKEYEVAEFLYEYCNPDCIEILEKISWEAIG